MELNQQAILFYLYHLVPIQAEVGKLFGKNKSDVSKICNAKEKDKSTIPNGDTDIELYITNIFGDREFRKRISKADMIDYLGQISVDIPVELEDEFSDETEFIKEVIRIGLKNKKQFEDLRDKAKGFSQKAKTKVIALISTKDKKPESCFVGRKDLIEKISQSLANGEVVLLNGIGGIGKTTLAIECAAQNKDRFKRRQLVTFRDTFENLIKSIRLENYNEDDIGRKIEKLKQLDESNLLIFDNIEINDEAEINKLVNFCKDLKAGLILTERHSGKEKFKFARRFPVEQLNDSEQLELFKKHLGEFNSEEEKKIVSEKILKIISGHPLLIKIVARTMSEHGTSAEDILNYLETGKDDGIEEIIIEKDDFYAQGKAYEIFYKTLLKSLDENSLKVLKQLYILPILGISNSLKIFDADQDKNALSHLKQTGWVNNENRILTLHPVIREVIKGLERLNYDTYYALFSKLEENFSVLDKVDTAPFCDIYHNFITIISGEDIGNKFGFQKLIEMGQYCYDRYKYQYSLDIYEKGWKAFSALAPEEQDDIIKYDFCMGLGGLYKRLADKSYQKALDKFDAAYHCNVDDLSKARAIRERGEVQRKSSNYHEAQADIREALRLFVEAQDLPREAEAINALGVVYLNIGDSCDEKAKAEKQENYDNAEKKYLEAKGKCEQILDETANLYSDETIKEVRETRIFTIHNLGTLYNRKGDIPKARDYHKWALDLREEHKLKRTDIAASYTLLAADYIELIGIEKDAEKHARDSINKALEIRKNILGEDHPDYAWSLQNSSDLYWKTGEKEKARETILQVIRIREKKLGKDHRYTKKAQDKLETYSK